MATMAMPVRATATETSATVLADRCRALLAEVARRGGPPPGEHLAQLRRLLARRDTRASRARWCQVERALTAAAGGLVGPVAVDDLPLLVHDLGVLAHVLDRAARVGARQTGDVQ